MDRAKLKAFVAAVEHDPGSLPKLVFADWLEENGDHDTGAGLRWCVKHGKWPAYNPHFKDWNWYLRGFDVSGNKSTRRIPYVACWLPEEIARELVKWGTGADTAKTWLPMIRRLGWALRRLRAVIN